MTLYPYSPAVPIDINGNLVTSGIGHIYDPADVDALDPLVPLGASGQPLASGKALEVTPLRLLPGFFLVDRPVVVWRSGTMPAVVLEAAGARIPPGGAIGQVLKKSAAGDYLVEWGAGGSAGGTATSGMVPVYEVGGKYIRPTQDPSICVVFTGAADPAGVAFENDRWERLA